MNFFDGFVTDFDCGVTHLFRKHITMTWDDAHFQERQVHLMNSVTRFQFLFDRRSTYRFGNTLGYRFSNVKSERQKVTAQDVALEGIMAMDTQNHRAQRKKLAHRLFVGKVIWSTATDDSL
jgi:hypothetical protein